MNQNTTRYYIREFINKPGYHSTGHIFAYIDKTDIKRNQPGDVSFNLGDCSRQISLSFDLYDAESRENSLYKIDLLIKALREFRTAFKAECAIQEAREIKRKQNPKCGRITLADIRASMVENGNQDS